MYNRLFIKYVLPVYSVFLAGSDKMNMEIVSIHPNAASLKPFNSYRLTVILGT